MDRLLRRTVLYDYYGDLLNDKQKRIVSCTVSEDMSLSEIGEREGISRQAASDLLKRADERLEEVEKALKVIKKTGDIRECLERIRREDISENAEKELKRIEEILE